MKSTSTSDEASLDEQRPSWVTVGRPDVRGICKDLISAVEHVARDLSLVAVVAIGQESQPEAIVGKLRGKTMRSIPLPVSCIPEAALSSVGVTIPPAVTDSLAARLQLAAVRMIPLDTAEERRGVLIVGSDSTAHSSFGDLTRLVDLCQQAALAISNLALRHQLTRSERYRRDADTLVAAACDLTSLRVAETLHKRIVGYAKDLAGAQLAFLALTDDDQQGLVVSTTCGERSSLLIGMRIPLTEGIAAKAIQDRAIAVTSDLMTDSRRRPAWERVRLAEGIHGSMWVPLFTGERLIGLLQVANRHVTQFTDEEARILQQLADIATVAMQNVHVYEQERDANTELENKCQSIAARCQETERRTSAVIAMASAVSSSGGLEGLCTALAGFLSNPVILCNRSGNVLVCKSSADEVPSEVTEDLVAALAQRESQFWVAIAKMPSDSRPHRLVALDFKGASVACVAATIVTGGTSVGYLLVPEVVRSLQESDLFLLEHAVRPFGAELLRSKEASRAQESLGADLLLDLLEQGAGEHSIRQAQTLGCSLDGHPRMAVFHMASRGSLLDQSEIREEAGDTSELLRAIRAELEMPSYSTGFALSALHNGLVVVVVPDGLHGSQWAEMHSGLAARFPNVSITASVSQPFKGIGNILPVYHNCTWTLRCAIRLGRGGKVVDNEELGMYSLLGQAQPRERLTEFAGYVLGDLVNEDRQHRSELLHTLDVYLRNSCRLQKAAHALCIHPHSLRYRIGQIEAILGHQVDDPAWREEAHVALAIARVEWAGLFPTERRS